MDNSFSRILKDAVFEIYPKEAQTFTKLRTWIQRLGGGTLIPSEREDVQNRSLNQSFSIPLIDLAWCKINNISVFHKPKERKFRDFYTSTFIYECYRAKQRLDLNSYRLGHSSFLTSYDANLFLEQKLSWDELLAKSCSVELKEYEYNTSTRNPDPDKEKQLEEKNIDEDEQSENESQHQTQKVIDDKEKEDQESSSGVINMNQVQIPTTSSSLRTPKVMLCRIENSQLRSEIRNTGKISNCKRIRRSRLNPKQRVLKRVPYSQEDSQKLLQYICNNNLHAATGGNLMWKYLEARRIVSTSRTHQSLKEHFRRQILPNLTDFCISPEDVQKFEDAKTEREKGKRKPVVNSILF